MGKKNKKKKQKFISKIIRDGRVTAKEARKAQKKGISLPRIQKAQTKSYKPGNVFSNVRAPKKSPFAGGVTSKGAIAQGKVSPSQIKTSSKPAYSPLVIQGKAQKIFDGQQPKPIASFPTPGFTPDGQGRLPLEEEGYMSPEFEALMEQNALLQQQLDAIPDFESIFAEQAEMAAQQRAEDVAAMQAQQALYMDEMAARQAEQERQRLLTSQTQQANMARASLTPDFSIGGRAQTDLYGTGGFKRRRRIRPATIAQGIAPTTPTAGATNGNLLNV